MLSTTVFVGIFRKEETERVKKFVIEIKATSSKDISQRSVNDININHLTTRGASY